MVMRRYTAHQSIPNVHIKTSPLMRQSLGGGMENPKVGGAWMAPVGSGVFVMVSWASESLSGLISSRGIIERRTTMTERIKWSEAMLPKGADRFPDGLGVALWAGHVDGELTYRIIKDFNDWGATYSVARYGETNGEKSFITLFRYEDSSSRGIDRAKGAAELEETDEARKERA